MPFRSGIRIEAGRQAGSPSAGEFNLEWASDASSGQRDGCDTTSHPHHALAGRTRGRRNLCSRSACTSTMCVCAHECALKRYSFYNGAALDRQRERALIPLLMAPLIGRLRWRSRFISNSESQLCPRIGTREDAVCTMRRRRSQQERNPGY